MKISDDAREFAQYMGHYLRGFLDEPEPFALNVAYLPRLVDHLWRAAGNAIGMDAHDVAVGIAKLKEAVLETNGDIEYDEDLFYAVVQAVVFFAGDAHAEVSVEAISPDQEETTRQILLRRMLEVAVLSGDLAACRRTFEELGGGYRVGVRLLSKNL